MSRSVPPAITVDEQSAAAAPANGWRLLLVLALLLPHVIIYTLNSTSTAFRLVAVGLGALAVVSVVAAGWGLRGLPRVAAIRGRVVGWQTPYIIGAVLVCVGFGVMMRPEWVYAHTGVVLALLLTLLHGALFDGVPRLSRRAWIGIGAGVVAVTLVRVYSLAYAPVRNVADEGWILGWALSYVRDGYFHDLIIYHGGADIQRFMLPVAWWISLFGSGFWQVRLFFFLATMLVILIGTLAARNLYRNGWITALVLFSSAVLMSGATIRHDIGLALAVAASMWLWSEAIKREQGWLHLLAGVMIGLGLFAHYHAILMGPAQLIGLYAPRVVAAKRLERGALLYIGGGLIGVLVVVIFQIIPEWEAFISTREVRSPLSLVGYLDAFLGHLGNIAALSKFDESVWCWRGVDRGALAANDAG